MKTSEGADNEHRRTDCGGREGQKEKREREKGKEGGIERKVEMERIW